MEARAGRVRDARDVALRLAAGAATFPSPSAGTRQREDGAIVTAGGRVLTVVGRGATLDEARARAYAGAAAISFEGGRHRDDIGIEDVPT